MKDCAVRFLGQVWNADAQADAGRAQHGSASLFNLEGTRDEERGNA